MITIKQGDCLELMKDIPDKSIDMILCDLPYGTTACKWDNIIPFEPLWEQYKRIIKENGAIVLFGAEPFSSCLRVSNIKQYAYDWVWNKKRGTGFAFAKSQPMRQTENISVFFNRLNNTIGNNAIFDDLKKYLYDEKEKSKLTSSKIKELLGNNMGGHYFTKGIQWSLPSEKDYLKLQSTGYFNKPYKELKDEYDNLKKQINNSKVIYYPQMIKLESPKKYKYASSCNTIGGIKNKKEYYFVDEKYPTNLLEFNKVSKPIHPTQKPVALLEYLIKTYTNENDVVLDNCMGSGSTGVACQNTNRNFIGFELDENYFNIAKERLEENERKNKNEQ